LHYGRQSQERREANVIRDIDDLLSEDDVHMSSSSGDEKNGGVVRPMSCMSGENVKTNVIINNNKKSKKPQVNFQTDAKKEGMKIKIDIESKYASFR
jgi:hypothetical protein